LGNSGITLVDWLPQSASFSGEYFNENILQRIAAELNGGGKKKHSPWTLLHMDKAKPHTSKRNLARMEELHLKRTPHPLFSPDIAPSDFFLFAWLKGELSSRSVGDISELFKLVDEILSTLTTDTIAWIFANWIERLEQVISTNGDYV
jgi:histone-lysine N-methyltransferase SETMAR